MDLEAHTAPKKENAPPVVGIYIEEPARLAPEVAKHLSCEPTKARLAVSMFLPGKGDANRPPSRRRKRKKAAKPKEEL